MTTKKTEETSKKQVFAINFLSGGLSGCIAVLFTLPIDAIKVRIQVNSENLIAKSGILKVAHNIFKKECGLYGFYKGLDSALCKAFVFQSIRFGLYFGTTNYLKKKHNIETTKLTTKLKVSLLTGSAAAIIGNPFDLSLLRFQVDRTLELEKRRNYKNVFNADRKSVV